MLYFNQLFGQICNLNPGSAGCVRAVTSHFQTLLSAPKSMKGKGSVKCSSAANGNASRPSIQDSSKAEAITSKSLAVCVRL